MSNMDKPAFDINIVIYPYIKTLCPKAAQQQWFLEFYAQQLKPYLVDLLEHRFFGLQKITDISDQLDYLRYYFAYLDKDTQFVPDKLYALIHGVDHIEPLRKDFENAYFFNILRRKQGFSLHDFYPSHYESLLKQLLQKTLLILFYEKIALALIDQPNKKKYQDYQRWVIDRVNAQRLPTKLTSVESQEQFYTPNLYWYALTGANRFMLFFQIELYHLHDMARQVKKWVKYIADNPSDYRNICAVFPLTAMIFCIKLLFLMLMPYRFLRTLVNECYDQITFPLQNFIRHCKPSFKNSVITYPAYMLMNVLIYGSLLTMFSLPLLPIPLLWIPSIFTSPFIVLVPLSYLITIPLMSSCLSVYREEFGVTKALEDLPPAHFNDIERRSSNLFEANKPQSKPPILNQYRKTSKDLVDRESNSNDQNTKYTKRMTPSTRS